MEGLLFLIGVQEFGRFGDFSKEEKEDLMHIAVCTLMGNAGYYEFQGRDKDDWPHFTRSEKVMPEGLEVQEKILKQQILKYFEDREE